MIIKRCSIKTYKESRHSTCESFLCVSDTFLLTDNEAEQGKFTVLILPPPLCFFQCAISGYFLYINEFLWGYFLEIYSSAWD